MKGFGARCFQVAMLLLAVPGLVIFGGVSCQSSKGDKPEPHGKDVQMTALRRAISSGVADPRRSALLMTMTDKAEEALGEINEDFLKQSKKLGKLTANHKKDATDMKVFVQEWNAEAHAMRERLLTLMFAMKGQTTPAEWPAISNAFINSVMQESDRYEALHRSGNRPVPPVGGTVGTGGTTGAMPGGTTGTGGAMGTGGTTGTMPGGYPARAPVVNDLRQPSGVNGLRAPATPFMPSQPSATSGLRQPSGYPAGQTPSNELRQPPAYPPSQPSSSQPNYYQPNQ